MTRPLHFSAAFALLLLAAAPLAAQNPDSARARRGAARPGARSADSTSASTASADSTFAANRRAARADSADRATAYLDPEARRLVALGRGRRYTVDRSIREYRALVKERISMGLRTLGFDHLFYRRETAGRIDWKREGRSTIQVLGAREVVPAVLKKAQIPDDLKEFMPHLAFDPAESQMMLGWTDGGFVRHPLAPGSEHWYRFRTGDTTTIRLPDGQAIRLIELKILPRVPDVHLITGSFWLESRSHAVVQAVFRLAREYDLERDADSPGDRKDAEDIPGILKPIRADVSYVTIQYGLWDLHWWMPRLVAFDGVAQVGKMMTLPLHYERSYAEYHVEGDTAAAGRPSPDLLGLPEVPRPDSLGKCPEGFRIRVNLSRDQRREEREERRRERRGEAPDSAIVAHERRSGTCVPAAVVVIPDSSKLLTSAELPPTPYGPDEALVSAPELEQLGQRLKGIAEPPWHVSRPTIGWGLGRAGMVRYNRVEALSIGAKGDLDLGRLSADGSARIGVADLVPNAEIGLTRDARTMHLRLAGYRRLALFDPSTRALGIGNSANALLFGRDDGDYYRALGAELAIAPPATGTQWYALRIYRERQRGAVANTDFSLRHLLGAEAAFRPNLAAAPATETGAALTLRAAHGQNPVGWRWEGELTLDGAGGTYDFFRPSALLRLDLPLPGPFVGSLAGAAGTSTGTLPPQSLWYLGGPASMRGYAGDVRGGQAFWRGRASVATDLPAARVGLFSDLGWAGPRDAWAATPPLLAFGAGASFLDGLVRFDISRAVKAPTGWRVDLYVSGR